MNVMILGSGGREHALSWKIAQSKNLNKLYIANGNAGTANLGENINISPTDFDAVATFAKKHKVSLIVVGPEAPLVEGITDYFQSNKDLDDIKILGPSKAGAMLEGSKDYAKEFMKRHQIPTAGYLSVTENNLQEGIAYLKTLQSPYVLKADGLAAGKGVLILDNLNQAIIELKLMIEGKFGAASKTVVIEEFLSGIELSVFVLTDGKNYKILPEAKDYKRIGENDTGLNTGGMGAISPVPFANKEFMNKVEQQIVIPTINGLIKDKIEYNGFIFLGLMNVDGNPMVIEYNVRMGDPESEAVIPRIKSDFLLALDAATKGNLDDVVFEIDDRTVSTVMLVSGGYPSAYQKGKLISEIPEINDCVVFHAGTVLKEKQVITNGGRVIAVSAYGNNIADALKKSYNMANSIHFEDMYYRKDIGFDLK